MIRPSLLLIELNEVNFDFVRRYVERGLLPAFSKLMHEHGVQETSSETEYEHLEPWIQWVTAHTGRTFAEHQVFRLGDIVNFDYPQIWEQLEAAGLSVGAISPMNAKHRLKRAAFFVPDPWTKTELTASPSLRRLYRAITQAVNDNASRRLTFDSFVGLLQGAAVYARFSNYSRYWRLVTGARGRPWRKAILLDLLLADVFHTEVRRKRPDFASLFVNAAAHIQHHYMFTAEAYSGPLSNPAWYVNPKEDPLLEVFSAYDDVLTDLLKAFPEARIMLATGLHQEPHEELTFYWRLRNHETFLKKIGARFSYVEPRMSRDFLIVCSGCEDASQTERKLNSARTSDGMKLFDVDNRGRDLFVVLSYSRDIPDGLDYVVEGTTFHNLKADVAFVAIKNGEHNGIGYFIDTGCSASQRRFSLAQLPERISAALLPAHSGAHV